jgi:hypothetical protein
LLVVAPGLSVDCCGFVCGGSGCSVRTGRWSDRPPRPDDDAVAHSDRHDDGARSE